VPAYKISPPGHLAPGTGVPLLYSLHKITLTSGPLTTISATRVHNTHMTKQRNSLEPVVNDQDRTRLKPRETNGCSCFWNVRKEKLQSTFIGFAMWKHVSQCENCIKFGTGSPKMCRISVKLDNNNVHRWTKMTCIYLNN